MDPFDLRKWPGFSQAGGCSSMPATVDQICIDSRRIHSQNALFVALKGENHDGHTFIPSIIQLGVKYALISKEWELPPEIDLGGLTLLRVDNPLYAFQQIAKAYRLLMPAKLIAITGSFGKTMVKDLLYNFLGVEKKVVASPESFNSQIGVPLSLLTIRSEHQIALIEAAISKKEEMERLVDMIQPDHTILTPIGKKHLNTLEDLSTIAQELIKLVLATPLEGWTLIPHDPHLLTYSSKISCSRYFWNEYDSNLPHAYLSQEGPSTFNAYQLLFPAGQTYRGSITTGYSYYLNLVNMAVKAAWLMGVKSQTIETELHNYKAEPMRTEIWKSPLGITFINDTYCSDPQSVDVALSHFESASTNQRKIFLFGGMRETSRHPQTEYRRIGKVLQKIQLSHLILYGNKPFDALIGELKSLPQPPLISIYKTFEEAIKFLQPILAPHDFVLVKGDTKTPLDLLIEAFNESQNNNQCTINLAAIKTNISTLREKLPKGIRMMVIVKALAYGTDAERMAKFLASCKIDILGVSYVDEGVSLRRAGIGQPIFLINAATYEAAKVVKWELEVGVSDAELIRAIALEAQKQNKKIKVHLHINTGMGRFGCRPEEALELALLIKSHSSLILEGMMTHFASAEDPKEDLFTMEQIQCFDQAIDKVKSHGIEVKWTHAANSSGSIRFHLPQYNMVRIGLAAYGLYGSEDVRKALDLRLTLTLTSRIIGMNICKKGDTISYGRKYRVEKEVQKIAVLPIGYFDGLHRSYSEKAHVLIRGQKAPMVGNICMDYMMVDVTDIPHVSVGDKVLIFGEDEFGQYLSPEDLATKGDSIVHELISCLGPRIQRIFVFEEGTQIR